MHFPGDSPVCRIFLWGMPGVGKSTLAKRLSTLLGWSFIDLDAVVEVWTGKAIPEIFKEGGEEAFRLLERDVLRKQLDETRAVFACGGGTPCFFDNAEKMLRAGCVIYLEATAAFVLSRLRQSKDPRPLLHNAKNLEDRVQRTLEQRAPFYARAHLRHRVPGETEEQLLQRIGPFIPGRS